MLDLPIQSNPSGAEVFIAGDTAALGKTPFRKKFEYRPDKATFLLFRLPGYRDLTHEVRPDWSGLVVLDPIPALPAPEVNPATPGKPSKSGVASKAGHRKNRKSGKEPDPFDSGDKGRTGHHAENPF